MRVHVSRIDAWMCAALGLPGAVGLACLVGGAVATRIELTVVGAAVTFVYLAIVILVVLPVRYTVGDHGIAIRAGRVGRVDVPWDQLISIWPSRSLLRAPALSMHRLVIKYRNGRGEDYVAISPRDRGAFVADVIAASRRHVLREDHVSLG